MARTCKYQRGIFCSPWKHQIDEYVKFGTSTYLHLDSVDHIQNLVDIRNFVIHKSLKVLNFVK